MLVRAFALLAALAVASPAAAEPAPASISMTVNSWGRLINGWTIRSDGSGEVRIGRQGPGGFMDVQVEVKRLGPDRRRYAQVKAMLRNAEARAGREMPCGSRITDLPYGEAHWIAGASDRVLHFDSGCQARDTKAIVDQLSAADRLVVGWATPPPATPPMK